MSISLVSDSDSDADAAELPAVRLPGLPGPPGAGLPGGSRPAGAEISNAITRNCSESTVRFNAEDKENHIDLTQEHTTYEYNDRAKSSPYKNIHIGTDEYKVNDNTNTLKFEDDDVVLLSGSSSKSVLDDCTESVNVNNVDYYANKAEYQEKSRKAKSPRTRSPQSDSTIELNYDDHDAMFDALFPTKSSSSARTNSQSTEECSQIKNITNGVSHLVQSTSTSHMIKSTSGVSHLTPSTSGVSHLIPSTSGVSHLIPSTSGESYLTQKYASFLSGSSGISTLSTSSGAGSGDIKNTRRKKRKSGGDCEEKARKRSADVIRKEAKKQKLLEEKAAKRAHNDLQRVYKPGECMKYIDLEVHPDLLSQWFMLDTSREVAATQAHIKPAPDLVEKSLILWSRKTDQLFAASESCERALLIMEAEQVVDLVSTQTLAHHLMQVRDIASCTITLVLFKIKDYFKSAGRKKKNNETMTEIDLEMAITDLLVSAKTDTIVVNTPSELALLIVHFTKAIAEEPYKRAKHATDEQAEFYMRGDNRNCVSVDKEGRGCKQLYQQMMAVLPQSSLETARALCVYCSSLVQLQEECASASGVSLLADIGVYRTGVPGARARKLGIEFSRRLATLLTSEDGDQLLD